MTVKINFAKQLHRQNMSTNININWVNKNGISYQDYLRMTGQLVKNNSTSGDDKTEERIAFTKLNFQRMKRINDKGKIENSYTINTAICVVVITEVWCGDSAQNIPWLEHFINKCNPVIKSYYVFRDENPDFMNQFLTNGSKSIPVAIFYKQDTGDVIGQWGPRPKEIKKWLAEYRANHPEKTKHDWEIELHKYYSKNKGAAIISDLTEIIKDVI